MGPAKYNGDCWDWGCDEQQTSEAAGALATALYGVNPYAAAAGIVAAPLGSHISKPDPKGSTILYSMGAPLGPVVLSTVKDTFTPQWEGVGWNDVPLAPAMRLYVSVADGDDGTADDPIGPADVGYDKIVEALRSQQIYQVPVHQQTNKQLLFVGLSVMAAQ